MEDNRDDLSEKQMFAEPNPAIISETIDSTLEDPIIVDISIDNDPQVPPISFDKDDQGITGTEGGEAPTTSTDVAIQEEPRMLFKVENHPTDTAIRRNTRRGQMSKKPIATQPTTTTAMENSTACSTHDRDGEDSYSSNSHCSSSSSSSMHRPERPTSPKRRRRNHADTGATHSEEIPTEEYDPPFMTSNGIVNVAAVSLNSHLLCSLCSGYYREPYTITECFHTFCKSCIFATFHMKYFKCPVCKISLEPDPYKVVISDRTMHELVMKLFPQLQQQDDEQERKFYEFKGIQQKLSGKMDGGGSHEKQQLQQRTSMSRRSKGNSYNGNNTNVQSNKRTNTNLSPNSNAAMEESNRNTNLTIQQKRGSSKFFLSDDKALLLEEIIFLLIPHEHQEGYRPLPPLRNPLIRTSGRLKIRLLRKYTFNNLAALDPSFHEMNPSLVEILCCGDPLGDELSITFVHKTRWVLSSQFSLTYRILDERSG